MALDHSAKSMQRTARTLFALEQMVNDAASRITAAEASIAALRSDLSNLELGDLADVDFTTPPSAGDTLTYNGSKWLPGASTGGVEVESGTGVPSGQPATTLIYLDTTGKRIYWRINSTVGSGAQWDYADGTGTYTEP